jgi:hypothetical protein
MNPGSSSSQGRGTGRGRGRGRGRSQTNDAEHRRGSGRQPSSTNRHTTTQPLRGEARSASTQPSSPVPRSQSVRDTFRDTNRQLARSLDRQHGFGHTIGSDYGQDGQFKSWLLAANDCLAQDEHALTVLEELGSSSRPGFEVLKELCKRLKGSFTAASSSAQVAQARSSTAVRAGPAGAAASIGGTQLVSDFCHMYAQLASCLDP